MIGSVPTPTVIWPCMKSMRQIRTPPTLLPAPLSCQLWTWRIPSQQGKPPLRLLDGRFVNAILLSINCQWVNDIQNAFNSVAGRAKRIMYMQGWQQYTNDCPTNSWITWLQRCNLGSNSWELVWFGSRNQLVHWQLRRCSSTSGGSVMAIFSGHNLCIWKARFYQPRSYCAVRIIASCRNIRCPSWLQLLQSSLIAINPYILISF